MWTVYEFKGFIIKFENTGKETSVNCLCKTGTFAGTGIKSLRPFKRDARLRDGKIKGVPKAGTNSRYPFYFRVAVERKSTVMENSVDDTFKFKICPDHDVYFPSIPPETW